MQNASSRPPPRTAPSRPGSFHPGSAFAPPLGAFASGQKSSSSIYDNDEELEEYLATLDEADEETGWTGGTGYEEEQQDGLGASLAAFIEGLELVPELTEVVCRPQPPTSLTSRHPPRRPLASATTSLRTTRSVSVSTTMKDLSKRGRPATTQTRRRQPQGPRPRIDLLKPLATPSRLSLRERSRATA